MLVRLCAVVADVQNDDQTCRDLLVTLARVYPRLLSHLLRWVDDRIPHVGRGVQFLFQRTLDAHGGRWAGNAATEAVASPPSSARPSGARTRSVPCDKSHAGGVVAGATERRDDHGALAGGAIWHGPDATNGVCAWAHTW